MVAEPGAAAATAKLVPVALRTINRGLAAESSTTVTVPLRAPSVAGLELTRTVQFAPTASLGPQSFVWVKSGLTVTC